MLNRLQQFASQCATSCEAIARDSKEAIGKHMQQKISKKANTLGFVTREEFDIQTKVLAKTRAKLERLERLLDTLVTPK